MAYSKILFNKAIEGLRKVNSEATNWLLSDDRPKRRQARHTFDLLRKSDHVTNNVCETFNSWVGADKRNTMLAKLESDIRVKSYDHLNFSRASVVQFERLDM